MKNNNIIRYIDMKHRILTEIIYIKISLTFSWLSHFLNSTMVCYTCCCVHRLHHGIKRLRKVSVTLTQRFVLFIDDLSFFTELSLLHFLNKSILTLHDFLATTNCLDWRHSFIQLLSNIQLSSLEAMVRDLYRTILSAL